MSKEVHLFVEVALGSICPECRPIGKHVRWFRANISGCVVHNFRLRGWKNPNELIRTFNEWIDIYNTEYLHSALGHKSPLQIEREHYNPEALLLVA
jgi:transposase InsO family protein